MTFNSHWKPQGHAFQRVKEVPANAVAVRKKYTNIKVSIKIPAERSSTFTLRSCSPKEFLSWYEETFGKDFA